MNHPPWKRSAHLVVIALKLFLAVPLLRAKDLPQATPRPDPALD